MCPSTPRRQGRFGSPRPDSARPDSRWFQDRPRCLITGAGGGIGRATSLLFAERGRPLVLVDKNEELLAETERIVQARAPGVDVVSEVCDVSDARAVQQLASSCALGDRHPDVVVNNAGVLLVGGMLESGIDDWQWVFAPNVWGVVHVCRTFAPRLARKRYGHIVNVASIAGLVSLANLSAYAASKHAVVALSAALRSELEPRGVGVSVVCPGLVSTDLAVRARVARRLEPDAARRRVVAALRQRGSTPEAVAGAIERAVGDNRASVLVGADAHLLALLQRLVPGSMPRILRWLAQ